MDEVVDPIAAAARERFGLDYLYPYQRLAVANILDAASEAPESAEWRSGPLRQIVLLPTGFGKSLCFQLPALLLPRPSLVVYPLLALMEDQRRSLEALGIPCALFRGGMSPDERRRAEGLVESGEAKIVISNPECLAGGRLLDFLASTRPSHVAIDEAHCVSEWGETFRPSYLELGRIIERLEPPALSAFTATASPSVLESVARILFRGEPCRLIEGNPDRPNIAYTVVKTLSRDHSLTRLARGLPRPLLVFASSREGVQMLARLLRERLPGSDVRFYHAGLERAEKKMVEDWFYSSRDGILCATCAYGMGVDKRDIRAVLHYDPPTSVEAYLQESGRGGRDGLPARALLLAGPGEAARLSREKDALRRSRFAALLAYAGSSRGCRREALLDLLGAPREGRAPCSGCDRCEAAAAVDARDRCASAAGGVGGRAGGATAAYREAGASAGRADRPAEGAAEIAAFAAANSGRFSVDEALALLRGGQGPRDEPPRCAHWGSLEGWDARDAARAMAEALRTGLVREGRHWPWKGMLGPGKGPT